MKKIILCVCQAWLKLDENFSCVNQEQQNSRISHKSSIKMKVAERLPSAQT